MAAIPTTRLLTPTDAPRVAGIDAEARAGDFLPSLGAPFLRALYCELVRGPLSWGHGALDEHGHVTGFLVGTTDTDAVFRALSPLRNASMFFATSRALLGRPTAIVRMVESLLYTSKEAVADVHAELIVVGTAAGARSRGIGKSLLHAFARELSARGVTRYRVTVKDKNERAHAFYARHGFTRASNFHLYGESWSVLVAEAAAQCRAFDAASATPGTPQ